MWSSAAKNLLLTPVLENRKIYLEVLESKREVYLSILACSKIRENDLSNMYVLLGNENPDTPIIIYLNYT